MLSDNNPKPVIAGLIKMRSPDGYKLLCDSYSAVVYGAIMRTVGDAPVAEELLAQTFTRVCTDIDEYQYSRLNFLSWVLQFARSISIDYISKKKNTDHKHRPASSEEPENIDLKRLPSPDKLNQGIAVFNMIIQGYNVHEIAAKLKMNKETVKANIRIGMKNCVNLHN